MVAQRKLQVKRQGQSFAIDKAPSILVSPCGGYAKTEGGTRLASPSTMPMTKQSRRKLLYCCPLTGDLRLQALSVDGSVGCEV